jgi:ATP-dependent DNA ligase
VKLTEFKYFYPEKPRLINVNQALFSRLSEDDLWVAERKYNGQRLQLHCINGEFQFWGRHGELLKYTLSDELLEELKGLSLPRGYCLLDGELRHNKVPGIQHKIIFYDVFIWDGNLLIGEGFWYRRAILHDTIGIEKRNRVGIPLQYPGKFRQTFDQVIEDPEIEGLVMKNMRGKLALGRTAGIDSGWMYKVRRPSGRYHF